MDMTGTRQGREGQQTRPGPGEGTRHPRAPRRLARHIATVYAALFFGIGVSLPFLPVWLHAKGLDARLIGIALALQSLMRVLVAPAVSHIADRLGRLRPVMAAAAAITLAALAWLAGLAVTPAALLVGVAVAYGAFAPLMPLSDAYAVSATRRLGLDYGRMRLWGSLAFIAGATVAGLVQDVLAARHLIWLIVIAHALLLLAVLRLPPRGEEGGTEERSGGGEGDGGLALLSPPFALFVIVAGLVQASHAFVYGFSALHWKNALGHGGTTVG
ncbi:MAG TPA: MFS transporter, partial [Thermopetrobacter sp.]|nr:MFS transporter [Thermopetrobacter sp.]